MKTAVGDVDGVAGNAAAVVSTCAHCRLFGTANYENSDFSVSPCSSRRLGFRASFLLPCRKRFGVVASGTLVVVSFATFYNHRRARGSLFAQLLQCATTLQTGQGVLRHSALECWKVSPSGTHAAASYGTVYSRRRLRAGISLFVQVSITSVDNGARSFSDVETSTLVASGRWQLWILPEQSTMPDLRRRPGRSSYTGLHDP